MKPYKLLLSVLILLISISAVSAADDSNSTSDLILSDSSDEVILSDGGDVENHSVIYADADNGNDSNDGLSRDSAVQTIGKAYDLVSNNGTIYLADGVYDNPQLFLYKSLSIIGSNNTIIEGYNIAKKGFVFRTWSGSYFAFKNIKFMNLKMRGNNAKIIQAGVTGSTVVIENCDFYNTNYGTDDAGATPVISVSGGVFKEGGLL